MPFYAHTSKLPDGKTTNPDSSTWEPLFTPCSLTHSKAMSSTSTTTARKAVC
jgi:hypothetical protein